MNRRLKIWLVKYFPFMANINFFVILILQLFDIDIKGITAFIFGSSILSSLNFFVDSIDLKFCNWHRVLLVNMFVTPAISIVNLCGVDMCYLSYYLIILTVFVLIFATIMMFKDGCTKTDSKSFKKG